MTERDRVLLHLRDQEQRVQHKDNEAEVSKTREDQPILEATVH
jgi:hypothetical protein